jgi:hypothetical protein
MQVLDTILSFSHMGPLHSVFVSHEASAVRRVISSAAFRFGHTAIWRCALFASPYLSGAAQRPQDIGGVYGIIRCHHSYLPERALPFSKRLRATAGEIQAPVRDDSSLLFHRSGPDEPKTAD